MNVPGDLDKSISDLAQRSRDVRAQKQQKTAALRAISGHPLSVFSQRNEALATLISRIKTAIEKNDFQDLPLADLRHLTTHYAMKGDLIYPLLKTRYGISGPSDLMWTTDDEIRYEIAKLVKAECRDTAWAQRFLAVLAQAEEMIYKDENILFPICALNFTEAEWMGIYHDAKDYPSPFGIEEVWEKAEEKQSLQYEKTRQDNFTNGIEFGEVVMPGGRMTVPQLIALLNTLPIEITFVDENNINRYFNEGPKVFKRPQMALGREVFSCHPPKIEPMVRAILDGFRNGAKDRVPVWMEKGGKPFLVTYMAVRDYGGKYLGAIELVQDMSDAKVHFCGE